MRRSLRTISVATLAAALAAPAFAQQADAPAPAPAATSRTTSYDAAFFTAAAPRNALDIARCVGPRSSKASAAAGQRKAPG